jgi:site-specific DNA-adenine methylase
MSKLIRFLPSYTGGKSYWVPRLQQYKGRYFAEIFAGSAVLSANLAGRAWLNDTDPYVYRILRYYDQLQLVENFTPDDYHRLRSRDDWWKYTYMLQKHAFSGMFRYSGNGYNVPLDKAAIGQEYKEDFLAAQSRYRELAPRVTNQDYKHVLKILLDKSEYWSESNPVIVIDPPYNDSWTEDWTSGDSYHNNINYGHLYAFIRITAQKLKATWLIFGRSSHLREFQFDVIAERKMRINGKHGGDSEGLAIINP